ncbi:MAG TPA: Gfo/Idh/MocA family oxidoreductase [Chloroflexota bacterium]|nr:Gfo/Idh/MocA family oxidoreductase [Chloroflexota bacterium]
MSSLLDRQKGITVGVLGTGRMANLHLHALDTIRRDGLTVDGVTWPVSLAVYGRDPAKVEALARQYRTTTAATDLNALIDQPDVAVIDNCLVNALHYGPLLRAVRNGKHCFTDKPLTSELPQAEALLKASREAGIHHGIVQNMRFQAGTVKAKELIDRGDLGRIFHVRVVFGYFVPQQVSNRPAWFYQKEQAGGGIVHDMMAHFFDLLRFMLGPIERVYGEVVTAFPERLDAAGNRFKADVEDATAVTIRFRSGVIADVFASWVRRKHEEVPFFEIDGEKGSITCSFNELKFQGEEQTAQFKYDPTRKQTGSDEGWQNVPLPDVDPFEMLLRNFLTAIVTDRPCKPDWEDAVINQRLIDAAYEAARTGQAVRVTSDGRRVVSGE